MEFLSIILLLAGLFVGLNSGVNDAAGSIGPMLGAGALRYRNALILFGIFAIIGAILQGHNTLNTVGTSIIDSSTAPIAGLISVLIATTIMVTLLASLGIPVSTTQSVLGGIAGIGIVYGLDTNWSKLSFILVSGFITPLIAIIVGYVIYRYLASQLFKLSLLRHESFVYFLLIIGSAFLAYSMGANGLGNSMGLVVGKGILTPFLGGVLGGIALSIGAATLGKRVIKTVSSEITQIDAIMAVSIQFATAITVYFFTLIGIPIPMIPAMVGSLIGVGLVKGVASIDLGTIKKIGIGWFTSPFIAALLTIFINSLIT